MIHVFILPYEWVLEHLSRNRIQVILSDSDTSKAGRFIHQADHDRYIAARLFLFGLLKQKKLINSETLDLSYNTNGKPYLSGKEIQFNWSHSGKMIALIISNMDCGIDIELDTGKELYDYQSLCTELELNWLNEKHRGTGISELIYFMDLWTAKESVLKAKGTGLSTDPRVIEIRHEKNDDDRWACYHETTYYGSTKPIVWKDQKYTLSFCSPIKTYTNPVFNSEMAKEVVTFL